MGEIKKKELPKIEPKKRVVPIDLPKIELNDEAKEPKAKKTDKYIRLAINGDIEERKQFASRVEKGEISLVYYAIDGDIGYHYYIVKK